MYRAESARRFLILEFTVDVFLNMTSAIAAYILTLAILGTEGVPLFESPRAMLALFFAVFLQSAFNTLANGYRCEGYRHVHGYLRSVSLTLPFFMIATVVAYFLVDGISLRFIYFWIVASFTVSSAMLVLKLRLISSLSTFIKRRSYSLRRVIIVGDNLESGAELAKEVARSASSSVMIIGYVCDKEGTIFDYERLGRLSDLADVLDKVRPTDAVFAIESYEREQIIRLVNLCDDRCIRVYFLPVIYGFLKSGGQIEGLGRIPLVNLHATPLDDHFNLVIKRLLDVFGSLFLIILTSPVMLAAAVGVYLSSPGPILFKQERVGRMGKRFTMLKFRSMRVNSRQDSAWSSAGDDRKTKFGAFIRRTSVDELPQLFNVLVGQMSLVGPRPEVPYFVDYFRAKIPLYMVKHYAKPGITGLSQVRGLRGDTSVEDRIQTDIEYIENWSLGLDLTILLYTPFKAVNRQERYVKPTTRHTKEVTRVAVFEQNGETEREKSPVREKRIGKILYAASGISHINSFHLDYIEALKRDGYEVRVMARGEGADYNIPFTKKMFSSSNKACRREIRQIIKTGGFEAIVLNTSLAAFHIRLALPKKERPRVVNIVHGYLFSPDVPLLRRTLLLLAEKLVASRTDSIIVMNEADRRLAIKHRLTDGRVVLTRGMGAKVQSELVKPEALRRSMGACGRFVMAFAGELTDRKKQEFLIYAFSKLKEQIPSAELWLIGDGPRENELRGLASELAPDLSIKLLGRREDVCDVMRACDLYVSASVTEGMPFNIIEAMACGKTVLASAVKGHTDIIEHGKSGFLYKFGDEREFLRLALGIYRGEYKLREKNIYARGREFCFDKVFASTYRAIKEAIENE